MSAQTDAVPRERERTQVGSLRHTLAVVWCGWRAALSGAAEYRGDLVVGTLVSLVWLGVSAVPSIVVTLHTDGAGGWTLPGLMYLLAIWYLMDAVMWIVIMPNIGQWGRQVQTGALDAVLLRPVRSLVMCSLGTLGVLTSYKVLTQVQFDASFLLHAGHNLARVPTPLYGRTIQVLLTWVVPVSFVATVPAQMMFSMASAWMVLAAVLVTAAVVLLVVVLWNREVRRYSGAMS